MAKGGIWLFGTTVVPVHRALGGYHGVKFYRDLATWSTDEGAYGDVLVRPRAGPCRPFVCLALLASNAAAAHGPPLHNALAAAPPEKYPRWALFTPGLNRALRRPAARYLPWGAGAILPSVSSAAGRRRVSSTSPVAPTTSATRVQSSIRHRLPTASSITSGGGRRRDAGDPSVGGNDPGRYILCISTRSGAERHY